MHDKEHSLEAAGIFQRLSALMLDLLIQFCLIYLIIPPLLASILPDAVRGYAVAASLLATFFLYEPILVSVFGQTLGHKYRKIRVVDSTTNERIGFFRALIRSLIKAALGLYSFLTMLGGRRQAVHDHLTRSKVVVVC